MRKHVNTNQILADIGEEQRGKIMRLNREGSRKSAGLVEDLAYLFADSWEKAEHYPREMAGEILALQGMQDDIVIEIIHALDATVVLHVMHAAGYDKRAFPLCTHSYISWSAKEQMWLLEEFAWSAKLRAIVGAGPMATENLAAVAPTQTKLFGKLDNAVKEARKQAKKVSTMTKVEITKDARQAIRQIVTLTTLDLGVEELIANAQTFVEEYLFMALDS